VLAVVVLLTIKMDLIGWGNWQPQASAWAGGGAVQAGEIRLRNLSPMKRCTAAERSQIRVASRSSQSIARISG